MAASFMLPLSGVLRTLRLCGFRLCSSAAAPSGYRSIYSLDKLYPNSGSQALSEGEEQTDIPVNRLSISYSKSSGPGGQHVNKVNTKAEVRFHLSSADWIPEAVRQNISVQYKNRINRNGELIVVSEVSRYQMRNLADCLQKIRNMISEATQKPQTESKEDEALRRIRVENMNRERLLQKKIHSSVKQSRKVSID
ncbi:peptidyl-tRNA hydrolase ICT1, mitochondrial [Bombina bombina]|uniref:peptidyl-tRNA hydrolase ICT1, mitochondrial n=1 Tax=Bombina bombina TaxID=8345 RepID=UPI00235ACCC0|nr:peptidyl-tRNA hydrolase ICT1, mitochondrial [Bombina bombina]